MPGWVRTHSQPEAIARPRNESRLLRERGTKMVGARESRLPSRVKNWALMDRAVRKIPSGRSLQPPGSLFRFCFLVLSGWGPAGL